MMSFYNIPSPKEKLFAASFYLGIFFSLLSWYPFIVILVINIRRIYVKDFLRYHAYQAMLLNMILTLVPNLIGLVISLLSDILSLFGIHLSQLLSQLCTWQITIANQTIMFNLLYVYNIFCLALGVYMIVWTARGRFTYLPPVSQAINYLLR